LPVKDDSTISIFADQPKDIQKMCSTVDETKNRIKCSDIAWQSGALPVSETPQSES
jgi:hypothetical protein